jgi:type I restriction enzyme, S subunit
MSNKLPNDWHVLELKELIDKKRSIRYGIVQPGEYDENGRYMVRGQDYSFGWVEPENLFKVSDVVESKYKNARLKTGDIILTIVGAGTGTVAIVPEWLNGANCTQTTARIAIEPSKADSLFCYYYLSSDKGKKLTYQNIKGGAQPGLNCGDIEYFEIILPPLPEQKAIAKVLSTADAAIHTTEKLIAQKELRKKWLMQQLLTGKMRLKGFENTKWQLKSLEEVAEFKNGKAHENSIDDNGEFIVINSKFISSEGKVFKSSNDNLCPLFKGDIAMVMSDIPNGKALAKCFYVEDDDKYTLNQRICSIRATKNTDSTFLFFIINRNVHYLNFDNGVGQTNLKKEEVLECPLLIPEKEEQTAIAQVLQTADKEISLLKAKAEKLREQKKGLMQQLLTGKIRIK